MIFINRNWAYVRLAKIQATCTRLQTVFKIMSSEFLDTNFASFLKAQPQTPTLFGRMMCQCYTRISPRQGRFLPAQARMPFDALRWGNYDRVREKSR